MISQMSVPYDLTLSDGSHHELYGPWRVDAAAELIRARRRGRQPLHVAASAVPCRDPYGVQIDPSAVVAVADRHGAVLAIGG
jgi:hypothetical protein